MKEFDWIARYFVPLAAPEGLGLKDDAALLTPKAGRQLVITTDAITAGVHFFADDAPDAIAQKLLRVNLSDLAAKGAMPRGYMLSLMLPEDTNAAWLEAFVSGLASDQARYGIYLFGGDTTKIKGPITASITAIGEVVENTMLRRSTAQIGDVVYMTGGIGNAFLGLKIREGKLEANDYLLDKYLFPNPRLEVGQELIELAHSCMDISDGLVQDAGHLADASNVGITINTSQLTLSREARDVLNQDDRYYKLMLTGGDDYELLFTAPIIHNDALMRLSERTEVTITAIGTVHDGQGVVVLDASGNPMDFETTGYQHF